MEYLGGGGASPFSARMNVIVGKTEQMFFKFQNETAFDEVFQQANFNSFIFRSRVKLETYNVSEICLIKRLWVQFSRIRLAVTLH